MEQVDSSLEAAKEDGNVQEPKEEQPPQDDQSSDKAGQHVEYQSLQDLATEAVTSKDLVSRIADWTAHVDVPDDDFHEVLDDLDDFKLPEVNWQNLEVKLRQSALEESLKHVSSFVLF